MGSSHARATVLALSRVQRHAQTGINKMVRSNSPLNSYTRTQTLALGRSMILNYRYPSYREKSLYYIGHGIINCKRLFRLH